MNLYHPVRAHQRAFYRARLPLLSRRGNLLADTLSLRLPGQALKPGAGRMSPLRGSIGCASRNNNQLLDSPAEFVFRRDFNNH